MPIRGCLLALLAGLSMNGALAAEVKTLRICANQALGAPGDRNSGYLLMRSVARQLPELKLEFTPLPWTRCLGDAAAGLYDAVLAASHTPERVQQGLVYPLDAEGRPDANRRMFQVGYVLLKRKDSPVRWDGERFLNSSTKPGELIGAERGYSIVLFARERGAAVEDRYPTFDSLVDALKLRRSAGVLVNQEGAAQLLANPDWAREHELGGPPMTPRAYYLPVSRSFQQAHPGLVEQLWAAVTQARTEQEFKRQFSRSMSGGRRRDIQP